MLRNFTPHEINIRVNGLISIPSEGVARVDAKPGEVQVLDGENTGWEEGELCPIHGADVMGEVYGLPEPREGVHIVVSIFVAQAMKGLRNDLVVPGTGPKDGCVRDKEGRIEAVTRLKRI